MLNGFESARTKQAVAYPKLDREDHDSECEIEGCQPVRNGDIAAAQRDRKGAAIKPCANPEDAPMASGVYALTDPSSASGAKSIK